MEKVQKHLDKLSEHKWKKKRQIGYTSSILTKKQIDIQNVMDIIGEYSTGNIYESDIHQIFQEPKHPRIKE